MPHSQAKLSLGKPRTILLLGMSYFGSQHQIPVLQSYVLDILSPYVFSFVLNLIVVSLVGAKRKCARVSISQLSKLG